MSAVQAPEGWQADLRLRFARRGAHTYLAHRQHAGPLLVQRPFHPEPNACHAYIVHPPGGVVGGDQLRLQVDVDDGAHALLTTPAAAKFYRSDGKIARQSQTLAVGRGIVEWLPQETIFYRDAIVRSETLVRLSPGAKFMGWEIPCLGLPARSEPFDSGDLRLHLELWLDNVPLLIDRQRIVGASEARTAPWGLAGHQAIGTLLAYPANRALVELARSTISEQAEFAVTLVDEVLVCRCVSNQGEPVRQVFIKLWQALRPQLLDCPAVLPRIWAT